MSIRFRWTNECQRAQAVNSIKGPYFEQLPTGQRLAQDFLHVAPDDEQRSNDGHQHPSEDEGEAHAAVIDPKIQDIIIHAWPQIVEEDENSYMQITS